MPQRIKILDPLLASKIAAGEVIERPASVLKELMENSLDAGATSITVHVSEGGKRIIRVVDNGEGIAKEDAALAFLRHATSKISTEEDLEAISTMGFRGEALSSISAVARVHLRTRRPSDVSGTAVTIEGGGPPSITDDGCPEGTSIEVKDLFYNIPARLKFLRSAESEFSRVLDIFKRIALINPEKRFKLVHGSARPVDTPSGGLRERISDLFGSDAAKQVIEVNTPFVSGFVGSHELTFATSKGLYLYVNGRMIRDKGISRAIIDGYGTVITGQRYPFAVLNLNVPPEDVDINIHPTKSEVRFKNPGFIYDTVKAAIKGALSGPSPSKTVYAAGTVSARPFIQEHSSFYGAAHKPSRLNDTAERFEFHTPTERVINPEFLAFETVGQLWGEFLVAQSAGNGGEFYLVDQHGAAERIAFEKLKKRYCKEAEAKRQMLLLPERFETTPGERDAINEVMPYLERIGFELMPFGPSIKGGGDTFLIKSLPDLLSSKSAAALILDLAEELAGAGGSSAVEERIEEALMRIACHSVIRGPRPLTREEGNALLREMAYVDFAVHCPHGRPVVKKFTRSEIEAFFKR